MSENKIKEYSTAEIEKKIAKCISELIGEGINAMIEFIDYNPYKNGSDVFNHTELHIIFSKPIDDVFPSSKGDIPF